LSGKIKKSSEMTERGQRMARKIWRKRTAEYRARKKKERQFETPPPSPIPVPQAMQAPSSTTSSGHRNRARRNRRKLKKEVSTLQVLTLVKKVWISTTMFLLRLLNLLRMRKLFPIVMSPHWKRIHLLILPLVLTPYLKPGLVIWTNMLWFCMMGECIQVLLWQLTMKKRRSNA
jgi:hypothetical protein